MSILLVVIAPSLGMEEVVPKGKEEEAEGMDMANARAFHARLIDKHSGSFQGDVQGYYKKIDPITSGPLPADEVTWDLNVISIDENDQLIPDANNEYTYNGISSNLDSLKNIDFEKPVTIPVTYNNKSFDVNFREISRKKIPVTTRLDDYNTCITDARENRLSLMNVITLKGILHVSGQRPHVIVIEAESDQQEQIILQGMEFVFNKNAGRTQIFLDCVDTDHKFVELIPPITCNHANSIADNTVFCIQNHKVYKCAGKTIYGFFDSSETRRKWVPDELKFYDLNNRRLIPLPSCYGRPDNHEETVQDPVGWVLGDGYNSFYQRESLEIQNSNDYVYCDDNNAFYALLPYRAVCKEYLTQDQNNKVRFDYLAQVKKPSLRVPQNVAIAGSHESWPSGLYKRVQKGNKISLRPIYSARSKRINLPNNEALGILWPAEPLDAQEIIQWGDAAQRFFGTFHANIRHCNRALSDKVSTWGKLNHLDLSRVELANDITWGRLLTAVGTMRQLTQFEFAYNHQAINRLLGKDPGHEHIHHVQGSYYTPLTDCLGLLRNLRRLSIQGSWLKNHAQLGEGCLENSTSPEIVSLLRTNCQIGRESYQYNYIGRLINTICGLPQLESLNIDGISNHSGSEWDRIPMHEKVIASPIWLLCAPLFFLVRIDGDAICTELVNNSADNLARMPSLRTISVHSPGGNCVNYFSQAFRERLAVARAAARAAHPNLPALAINAEVLQ